MEQSTKRSFVIQQLPERIAVVHMDPGSEIPPWAWNGSLAAVIQTTEELTIVCDQTAVPGHLTSELGRVGFKLEGPLPFTHNKRRRPFRLRVIRSSDAGIVA
jgi:hypothetical protein